VPELPDIEVYADHLRRRVVGQTLENARVASAFLVRTFDPPLKAALGKRVTGIRRMGKRLVFDLEDDLHLVLHLMVAGRLRWREVGAKVPGKLGLAALDPGGLEPLGSSLAAFTAALRRESHTVKRALTDPHLLSGIGNAYSDEILWRARLSPLRLTGKLTDDELARLHEATQATLIEWTERLAKDTGDAFPEKVTAFRDEMAVHGKYRKPCPACGAPVQRIAYTDNEANYCAECQTGGKLLADRSLSRLMHDDWPRTLEELEGRRREK
jgi:formamidopyrimidine-DNA glycosylase